MPEIAPPVGCDIETTGGVVSVEPPGSPPPRLPPGAPPSPPPPPPPPPHPLKTIANASASERMRSITESPYSKLPCSTCLARQAPRDSLLSPLPCSSDAQRRRRYRHTSRKS